jgi:hypothetical protein
VKYFIALAMFVYADDEGRPESPFVVCEREVMDHAPDLRCRRNHVDCHVLQEEVAATLFDKREDPMVHVDHAAVVE